MYCSNYLLLFRLSFSSLGSAPHSPLGFFDSPYQPLFLHSSSDSSASSCLDPPPHSSLDSTSGSSAAAYLGPPLRLFSGSFALETMTSIICQWQRSFATMSSIPAAPLGLRTPDLREARRGRSSPFCGFSLVIIPYGEEGQLTVDQPSLSTT
jgi:hypothetical protein